TPYEKLELIIEQPVDFESLKANGYDVKKYFENQYWMNFFDILNGPVYTELVKDFWPRCEVVEKEDAEREYKLKVAENPKVNKGKSRSELGLRDFTETEIRSGVSGFEEVITQTTIAELLKIPNEGFYIDFSKEGKDSPYANMINRYLYETEITEPTNKTLHLKKPVKVLVKIMQGSIFPRSGGTDQVSWNHRHFLYFLYQNIPLNLAAYIFNQLCASIRAGMAVRNPSKKIVYPRLISELFHQCTVVRRIQEAGADFILTTARGTFLTGKSLKKMNLLSEPVKYPNLPLLENHSLRPINEATPMVFEDEPKEVIQNYIKEMVKQGKMVSESDVGKSSKDGKDPRKRRRVRCQSEETIVEQPSSKVTASDKGKRTSEQVVIKDVPQKVATTVKKEAVKRKAETEVKGRRKLILPKDVDDDEETDDEEPQMKRTRKVLLRQKCKIPI
ncbi:hypothetical protein L195_g045984, partial [Trifolium pratense]